MSKYVMIFIGGGYLMLLAIYASIHEPEAKPTDAVTIVSQGTEAAHEAEADDHIEASAKESAEVSEKESDKEEAHHADEVTHKDSHQSVSDDVIAAQRKALASNTEGKGFGPQSPRDIDSLIGNNPRQFAEAPAYTNMNLCNIHFHKNAEHKGGEFTFFAGNGDGSGYQSGYKYSGSFSESELQPTDEVCPSDHGALSVGDTIEVHYVHSSAQVEPGPTLGACLSDAIGNPQLRVETQVYVLVNDDAALDFVSLTEHGKVNGLHQALNIPTNTGAPVQYAGSTTGPGYNEKGSPFQVSWSVRPKVAKVNAATVGKWCEGNIFDEDHAHGVRNLVVNPDLLSKIH